MLRSNPELASVGSLQVFERRRTVAGGESIYLGNATVGDMIRWPEENLPITFFTP